MKLEIPGRGTPLEIQSIVLDLNGTVAIDGILIEGVAERIAKLKHKEIKFYLFTGDTHGNGAKIAQELGIEMRHTPTARSKLEELEKIGKDTSAAIGNGRIDVEMLRAAALPICALQAEGGYSPLIRWSQITVTNINDALDLFINEKG